MTLRAGLIAGALVMACAPAFAATPDRMHLGEIELKLVYRQSVRFRPISCGEIRR